MPLRKEDKAEGVNPLCYTQLHTQWQYGRKRAIAFCLSISLIFLSRLSTRSPHAARHCLHLPISAQDLASPGVSPELLFSAFLYAMSHGLL